VSDRLGVEITRTHVRAVAVAAWGDRPRIVAEIPWDAEHPAAAVALLSSRFGRVGRIALALGLDYLHVKHVDLPPAPLRLRRQMIAVEPDRFFPVQDERVAVGLDGSIAFAVDQADLDRWVEAFETWAPVESIEPAPVTLARALGRSANGAFTFALGDGGLGVIEMRHGSLASARHLTSAPENVSVPGHALPPTKGVAPESLAAWGAALGLDGNVDGMMVGDRMRETIMHRRTRRIVGAAAAAVLALGFALWALDRSRDDVLARLVAEQQALETRAAPAAALQAQLVALAREESVAAAVNASRADPLSVIAALGERLPRDVTVLNARAIANEWRIDGTAMNAAAILPALDGDPRFADARFLAATSRYREGGKTYESFSLAFRANAGR
jgi:hypothetical protein